METKLPRFLFVLFGLDCWEVSLGKKLSKKTAAVVDDSPETYVFIEVSDASEVFWVIFSSRILMQLVFAIL